MRTLGIIGGIAPPSTIDYYRHLTTRYAQRSPDGSYPQIILDSIDGRRFFALLEAADRPAMIDVLLAELERLACAGRLFGAPTEPLRPSRWRGIPRQVWRGRLRGRARRG